MRWRAIASALRFGLLALLVVGAVVLARLTPLGPLLEDTGRAIVDLRASPWAPAAFVAFYMVAIGLGMPGTALTLLGGTAFGIWPGLAVNLAGALAGASVAFLEARYLGRETVTRLLGERLAWLGDLARPRVAFVAFARLRLIPVVPYNATNFAAGLTAAPFPAYLAGTAVGIVPSTTMWTYFASALAAGDARLREVAGVRIAIALGGLLLLSLVPWAVGRLRRASRRPRHRGP